MRGIVAVGLGMVVALAACDRGGDEPIAPSETPPASAVEVSTTSSTTRPAGCDDDLVGDVIELIQDRLDELAGRGLAEVLAGAGGSAEVEEREAALGTRVAAEGCPAVELLTLVRAEADRFDAEGPAAERYLELVLDPSGAVLEP